MKKTFILFLSAVAVFSACNKAEVSVPVANDNSRAVKFVSSNLYSFDTKAAMAASSSLSVFAYDATYVNENNRQYTVESMPDGQTPGTLSGSSILWGREQMGTSNNTTFFAIYPYADGRTLNPSTNLAWSITSVENVEEAMDVLVAYAVQNPGADVENPNKVSFAFSHPFSLLEYTVTNTSDDTINYIEVSDVYVNGSIVMGAALTDKGASTGTQRLYYDSVSGKYYGVIYPANGVSPQVTIHFYSGTTATYTVASATDFAEGNKYSATLAYNNNHAGVTSNSTVGFSFTASQSWNSGSYTANPAGGTPANVPDHWPFLKGSGATLNSAALDWDTGVAMKCVNENSYYAVIELTAASAEFKVNHGANWYGWNGDPSGTVSGWKKYVGNGEGNITVAGEIGDKVSIYYYITDSTNELWWIAGDQTR